MRNRLNRLSKSIYVNTRTSIEEEVDGNDDGKNNFDALTERSFRNSMGPTMMQTVQYKGSKNPLNSPNTTAKKSKFGQTLSRPNKRTTLTNVDLSSYSLSR